jgi:hypothetical protein
MPCAAHAPVTVVLLGQAIKRSLTYSHDTFGLGNIRRMLEVARHMVEPSDQVSILVATGTPMLHAFRPTPPAGSGWLCSWFSRFATDFRR